jgi:streptomycin 6-kinase
MQLSTEFNRNIQTAFGAAGRQWLLELPFLLEQAIQKWDLTPGQEMPLSYNYVIAAKRARRFDVVLKIGVPNKEFSSELAALRHFGGDGCVRMLDADDEKFMFLMERLKPGKMLVSVADDEKRTRIACDVMTRLWQPAPEGLPLLRLSDWFGEFSRLPRRFGGGSGPLSSRLFERAVALLPSLFADSSPPLLLHGDLHHFNILSSQRGWLAIDPKGVIGPPGYECGPLLINPMPHLPYRDDAISLTGRRIAILSEQLGFSRELVRTWGFCHAMLSAFWDITDDNTGWEYSQACAELIWDAGS